MDASKKLLIQILVSGLPTWTINLSMHTFKAVRPMPAYQVKMAEEEGFEPSIGLHL